MSVLLWTIGILALVGLIFVGMHWTRWSVSGSSDNPGIVTKVMGGLPFQLRSLRENKQRREQQYKMARAAADYQKAQANMFWSDQDLKKPGKDE